MPVVCKPLSRQDREMIAGFLATSWVHGECYAFAIALHRDAGLPIVGLMHEGKPWHVGLRISNEQLFDGRGPISVGQFLEEFPEVPAPYQLVDLTPEDLCAVREVSIHSIDSASWMAELLWPKEVPWKHNSFYKRAVQFAEELEALSLKHGIYIRESCPGSKPVLYDAYGSERGYSIEPMFVKQAALSFGRVYGDDPVDPEDFDD